METTVLTLPPIEAVGGPHDYLKILCPASLLHLPFGDPADWWPLVPVEWPLVTGMKLDFNFVFYFYIFFVFIYVIVFVCTFVLNHLNMSFYNLNVPLVTQFRTSNDSINLSTENLVVTQF